MHDTPALPFFSLVVYVCAIFQLDVVSGLMMIIVVAVM